ncbi:hypothetical protein DVH24_022743 [Malus domestica]|uniref:MADS-box domain-containing protein n=1 Tax=Malus domestica TaxID=3750 RepID=A0A498KKA4_MALDO|nr:hypothetical protein DVH24_022743 [Malus domestica]
MFVAYEESFLFLPSFPVASSPVSSSTPFFLFQPKFFHVSFSIFWTVKEGEFKRKIRGPKCRMGRVKLKIKGLENTNGRQATYAKRKNGIMKKANELSILCDIDIVLLMFSPTGKPSLCNGEGRKE